MAGSAHPSPGARGSAFDRASAAEIRTAWRAGTPPTCPGCSTPLAPQGVPPREDVPYVRDRVLLVCPSCRRSTAVERREHPDLPKRLAGHEGRKPPDRKKGEGPSLGRVGWREWVHLQAPDGSRVRLKAKVDTGARTSALHAEALEAFERGGAPWLRFRIHPRQGSRSGAVIMEAPLVDRRSVRSSSGEAQTRSVVRMEVGVGAHAFEIEVTLARRDQMGFRMLLGRTALRGRFLVDPGSSYLQPGSGTSGGDIPPSPPPDPSRPIPPEGTSP